MKKVHINYPFNEKMQGKFKTSSLAIAMLVFFSISYTLFSCKKTKIESAPIQATPAYAVAGTEKWEAFLQKCVYGSGDCGLTVVEDRDTWIKADMEPDGVKFDAWASKDAAGNIIIKMNVVDMNLKEESKDWYLIEKKFGFDTTTFLPQEFINAVCKASGLKERPDANQYYFPTGKYSIKFKRSVGIDEKFNMYREWRPHPAYPVSKGEETDEFIIY